MYFDQLYLNCLSTSSWTGTPHPYCPQILIFFDFVFNNTVSSVCTAHKLMDIELSMRKGVLSYQDPHFKEN